MKKNRIVSAILIFALCSSAFISCGKKENLSVDNNGDNSSEKTVAVTDENGNKVTTVDENGNVVEVTEKVKADTDDGDEDSSETDDGIVINIDDYDEYDPDADIQEEQYDYQYDDDGNCYYVDEYGDTYYDTNGDGVFDDDEPEVIGEFTHDDMNININGARCTLLSEAGGFIAALGEPDFVEEFSEYLDNGADVKMYCYSDMTVYVYLDGDREIIYEVEIESDDFVTSKGLYMNMDIDEVTAIYGEGDEVGDAVYFYDTETQYMYLVVTGGIVTTVTYAADVA